MNVQRSQLLDRLITKIGMILMLGTIARLCPWRYIWALVTVVVKDLVLFSVLVLGQPVHVRDFEGDDVNVAIKVQRTGIVIRVERSWRWSSVEVAL